MKKMMKQFYGKEITLLEQNMMRGIFRGKLKDFKEHVFHESKTRTLFERL
jgi:hypothetical protein